MQCPACNELIDDDSCFCDMCSVVMTVCGSCRTPVSGKCCTQCGKPSVLASSLNPSQNIPRNSDAVPISPGAQVRSEPASANAAGTRRLVSSEPTGAAVPKLRLRNKSLNIDLDVANDAEVGRSTGPYSSLFGKFDQVSSRHCVFRYDFAKGWCVMDLGSTNKTYYNNMVLVPNLAQSIGDGSYLKIANIEFFVSVGSG